MKLTSTAANTSTDAVCSLLNGGFIRFYDQQVLLAELRFSSPAFSPAIGGEAKANPITEEASAVGSGTAKWARALMKDGHTAVWDATVGTDIEIDQVKIVKDAIISVTSMTYRQPQ
jgi:hypothetical protein